MNEAFRVAVGCVYRDEDGGADAGLVTAGAAPSADDSAGAERLRIAWHECGHAVATYLLNGRVHVVSINPSRRWSGVVFATLRRPPARDLELIDDDAPLCTWPPRVRRYLEASVLVTQAGPTSELVRPNYIRETGYVKTRLDDRLAEQALIRLTRSEAQLLATGDERDYDPADSDEARSYETASLLSRELVPEILTWLQQDAQRWVRTPRFKWLVGALAPVLLERGEIGGRDAHTLLKEADARGRAKHWSPYARRHKEQA